MLSLSKTARKRAGQWPPVWHHAAPIRALDDTPEPRMVYRNGTCPEHTHIPETCRFTTAETAAVRSGRPIKNAPMLPRIGGPKVVIEYGMVVPNGSPQQFEIRKVKPQLDA